jgi:hypothetical protein
MIQLDMPRPFATKTAVTETRRERFWSNLKRGCEQAKPLTTPERSSGYVDAIALQLLNFFLCCSRFHEDVREDPRRSNDERSHFTKFFG